MQGSKRRGPAPPGVNLTEVPDTIHAIACGCIRLLAVVHCFYKAKGSRSSTVTGGFDACKGVGHHLNFRPKVLEFSRTVFTQQ